MQYESELYHYGIKGMKWGVRRYQNPDGSLTSAGKKRYAENYSEQQRTRDRKLYGSRAVNRINKRMLKGESIQSARHDEVVRRDRLNGGKAIARTVAKGALTVAGTAAVYKVFTSKGFDGMVAGELSDSTIRVGKQVINMLFKNR